MREFVSLNLNEKIQDDLSVLSKKQVCEKYDISIMTLNNWMKDGLRYFKVGKSKSSLVKFKNKHIQEYLNRFITN